MSRIYCFRVAAQKKIIILMVRYSTNVSYNGKVYSTSWNCSKGVNHSSNRHYTRVKYVLCHYAILNIVQPRAKPLWPNTPKTPPDENPSCKKYDY